MSTEHKPHSELLARVREGITTPCLMDVAPTLAAVDELEEQLEALRAAAQTAVDVAERSGDWGEGIEALWTVLNPAKERSS